MVEAANLQRQHHIVECIAVEQQFVVLENQSDVAAQLRDGGRFDGADVLAFDQHAAAAGALDGGDEFEQRAFARAGVAGEINHLALGHVEAQVLQRFVSAGVAFIDLVEFDHCEN